MALTFFGSFLNKCLVSLPALNAVFLKWMSVGNTSVGEKVTIHLVPPLLFLSSQLPPFDVKIALAKSDALTFPIKVSEQSNLNQEGT